MNIEDDLNSGESIIENLHIVDDLVDTQGEIVAVEPQTKARRLSEVLNAKPIIPIPEDGVSDVFYSTRMEPRCVLCKSPYRERAEHWYLENNRKPNAVVNFFRIYFNAMVSWDCVDNHMNYHCEFKHLGKNGLIDLEQKEADMARWRYRELDVAITLTLDSINDVQGMNCSHKPDLKFKQINLLDKLGARLVDYRRISNELGNVASLDTFAILMDIWKKVPDEESKEIILNKVREIREQNK